MIGRKNRSRGYAVLLAVWLGLSAGVAGESLSVITFDNHPMGTEEKPLVLRTFFPDPGVASEVLEQHERGSRSRKYSPSKGDVEGYVEPVRGFPAAIGVNFGPKLSICWDTVECRLMYAWQGGFLDMTNYWGDPASGRRVSFGYVPVLEGSLIYRAEGTHPLVILDDFLATRKPRFLGYRLVGGVPEFHYVVGENDVFVRIEPGEEPLSIVKQYRLVGPKDGGDYAEAGYKTSMDRVDGNTFGVTIVGRAGMEVEGTSEPEVDMSEPNAEWGEWLYTRLGCIACHSTDGTRGHGPSLLGVIGGERKVMNVEEPVKGTPEYILESIKDPMAKIVEGYPPGYMPPYHLEEGQIESLALYLETLKVVDE